MTLKEDSELVKGLINTGMETMTLPLSGGRSVGQLVTLYHPQSGGRVMSSSGSLTFSP